MAANMAAQKPKICIAQLISKLQRQLRCRFR